MILTPPLKIISKGSCEGDETSSKGLYVPGSHTTKQFGCQFVVVANLSLCLAIGLSAAVQHPAAPPPQIHAEA